MKGEQDSLPTLLHQDQGKRSPKTRNRSVKVLSTGLSFIISGVYLLPYVTLPT